MINTKKLTNRIVVIFRILTEKSPEVTFEKRLRNFLRQ